MKKWTKVLIVFVPLIVIAVLFTWHIKRSSVPSILSKAHALETLYTLADTKDVIITPLKGGLSESTLYKVDSKDQSYVIRLINHRSMQDKLREINAQAIASQEGWGPKLYASDIDKGWIIMEYIKPTPLTQADRVDDKMYRELGKCLQKIHTGPNFLPGKPILKEIEELLEKVYKEEKILQIDYGVLQNILELVKKNHSPIVTPTHRDLNPNNTIFSGNKPFIIDFENAAQDDPFYDLATVGMFYIFNAHHEKIFLDTYFNHAYTQQEYVYYQIMKQAVRLFYGLNFLDFVPQEVVKNASVQVEPFEGILESIANRIINIADHGDQLKIAVSLLQEAINEYNAEK